MEAIFIPGGFFAFILMLVWLSNRKKERMFLLNQGKDPNLVNSKEKTSSINYLKWAIIIIGIGMGMLLGTIIGQLIPGRYDSLYFSCLLIFSGIGIIVSFWATRRMYPEKPHSDNQIVENEEKLL
jgi:hypothetical protein